MLARHPFLNAALLLVGAPLTSHAQFLFGEGAKFPEGPPRQEVEAELTYIDVPEACSLRIAISVDRKGAVVSAEVDDRSTTCTDTAVFARALRSVRGRVFNADPKAPALQRGMVQWTFQEPSRELGYDLVAMPEAVPEQAQDPNEPLTFVEEMPEFPGGQEALLTYLVKKVEYPKEAMDAKVEGNVYISFIVERDGKISEVKALRGIGGGCDEEAVRVVKSMPKWKPGKQNGKPVRVRYNMPIRFKL